MIERMKKFLWLVVAAVMLPSVAVAQEFTAENDYGYELNYRVLDADSKTVEVIGINDCDGITDLFIPATVSDGTNEYTVTKVGDNAFSWFYDLKHIDFPSTLEEIGREAFKLCLYLEGELRIPGNVKKIGDYAFYGAEPYNTDYGPNESLKRIVIEEGVEEIGEYAFGENKHLKYISFPSTIKKLGKCVLNSTRNYGEGYHVKTIVLKFDDPMIISEGENDDATFFLEFISSLTPEARVYVPADKRGQFSTRLCAASGGWDDSQIKGMNLTTAVEEEHTLTTDASGEYIVLEDGEPYTNEIDLTGVNVRYNRDFNTTNWQAMFVPANFAVSEMQRHGQLGELLNIRTDVEGDLSTISMVWQMVTEGSIRANYPYIFCPKTTGAATFEGQGLRLRSASDLQSERFLIRTNPHTGFTRYNYVPFLLTGTYTEKTDMATCGAYALSGGVFKKADSDDKHLAPYRIYLVVNNGDELPGSASYAPIRNIIIDENGDATLIEGVLEGVEPVVRRADGLYDLQGRRVSPAAKGIVIENGQKVLRK